jgi:asparagine synthase (glutamine-hydrolysing)
VSAFAVIFERAGAPADREALEQAMGRLSHRGPDGADVRLVGRVAMGHLHLWTTPEEMGETQPLQVAGMPFTIVVDGRLDNRQELIADLGLGPEEGCRLSDAALILRSHDRWRERCFERFIGPFALALWDEQRGELLCARDALGDRTLFCAIRGTKIIVASEPWAALGGAGLVPEMDEVGAAHYFALHAPEDGRTLFKDVRELLPAEVVVTGATRQRSWRYWQPAPVTPMRGKSDAEYAEQFRALLEESVRCRLRSAAPVGVLMSGGLDSTSVACLAASMLAGAALTTVSYVFDELTDCDERQYIDAVKARWGVRSIQIPCDDLWPLRDWQNWPRNPNQPEGNPYRLLKETAYRRARQEGVRVLLTGGFGDHLYGRAADWLSDLLAEGRFLEAGRELARQMRAVGLRAAIGAPYVRRTARRALNRVSGRKRVPRPGSPRPWLTPWAASQVLTEGYGAPTGVARQQQDGVLGIGAAHSCSSEIFNASRCGVELRHPYRDRRLVQFVLGLPGHQLYRRGLYKHVLRTAMEGTLPEVIRTRPRPTSLAPLFQRGLERERDLLEACLRDPGASWPKFADEKWLLEQRGTAFQQSGPEALAPWLCVSFESWCRSKHLLT